MLFSIFSLLSDSPFIHITENALDFGHPLLIFFILDLLYNHVWKGVSSRNMEKFEGSKVTFIITLNQENMFRMRTAPVVICRS